MSRVFIVKKIDCFWQDQTKSCSGLEEFLNRSIFFTKLEELDVYQKVVEIDDELYQVIALKKQLPDNLLIYLDKKQLVYALEIENGERYHINDDGLVKKYVSQFELPVINLSNSMAEQYIEDKILDHKLHNFIKELLLNKDVFDYKRIRIQSSTELILELRDYKQVVMQLTDSAETELLKLKLILEEFDFSQLDSQNYIIDLRFKMPIVKAK